MPTHPPALQHVEHAISDDGEATRITVTTADGQTLAFQLGYRQLGRFIEPLRQIAGEMRDRLLKNGERLKAEVVAELAEARTVDAVLFALDEATGEHLVSMEGKELGVLTVRLPADVAQSIAQHLATPQRSTRH